MPDDLNPTRDMCTAAKSSIEQLESLTAFQLDVLYILANISDETTATGVIILDELNSISPGSVSKGRLYQNLRSLVSAGHIDKMPVDGRTNAYQLTEDTHEALYDRCTWQIACLDYELM